MFDQIRVPKQLYSDQEGSFNTAKFIRLLNKHKVKHIMVVDKAHTVERFHRTLKENIHTRLHAMGLSRDKWTSQLEAVVNKYNNTVHSTIKMRPNDGRREGNKLTASFNIWAQSKKDRVYPELKVGDEVRVMLTKDKGQHDTFKILHIKDHDYLVNNNRRKVYLRHEVLKVV